MEAIERVLLPKSVLDETKNVINNSNFTVDEAGVRENIDYFTMTYDNRTLNLDTIVAARDQLVTGVRFRVYAGAVHLEARFTYFDEAAGTLDLSTASEWKMNSNNQRTTISTEHTDIPTRSQVQSIAIGTDDSNSVRFVPTGWVRDMVRPSFIIKYSK